VGEGLPERLRIAIFSDSALPILNGVSISINALVTELRHRGHSVHIYTAKHFRYRDPDPNTYRFPAIETPWTKGYPLAYPPFFRMLHKFRRHEYDILHSHTPFTIGMVGLRWAESHEIPIVSTYHTLYDRYAHYIPFFPRRYVRFKIAKHTNYYYNRVCHVITPSEASMKWLRRHAVDTPVTVIPTAVPSRGFFDRSEVRHQLGVHPEQRVMLYVGRIAREKNLETLFEMAAITFREDPSLRLWLVGDGPHRAACAQLARDLGIGDRVTFFGFVPRAEVDRYYAAADLFVFSSITETQGLVVQEAMTYGLPAIAVTGGGASAAIRTGENGFIVKNEPQEFAQAVLKTFEDERLYAKLAEGAVQSVRTYGNDEMVESVLKVYADAMSRHRSTQLEMERKHSVI
jgi:1,2-diacylglycerol 3-alpha-glucosyltransferase